MNKNRLWDKISALYLGKRYFLLTDIDEQVRYMTINSIYMVATIPLVALGITMIGREQPLRSLIDFGIAAMCILAVILIRTKVPLKAIINISVTAFGCYCVYLVYSGDMNLWAAVWFFAFPPIVVFLCRMTIGFIESAVALVLSAIFLYIPYYTPVSRMLSNWYVMKKNLIIDETGGEVVIWDRILFGNDVKIRVILAYILIFAITIIYERISILKDRKEKTLQNALAHERDVIQTMKDNIPQGIFLMDKDLKIQPQYSIPLTNILSYYEDVLTGKNFLDILSNSLDSKQLQIMKGYFNMMFSKSKSARVLESANPIAEFEYNADGQTKVLTTKFSLVEEKDSEPVIIGIIQDITKEKEFEKELQTQKKAQEREMKNMFDVIQIDPLVFQDFIEDTETSFNYINAVLKDKSLSEREVVTKFFQNIHAIKSNALILGLENFGTKLHDLEDSIKKVLAKEDITVEDTLGLAITLEQLMQEKDSYKQIINRIESFKVSHQFDSILVHTLSQAVEKVCAETKKKVDLETGHIDMRVLETKLRKPIKDILLQCVRNSVYHGIESPEERKKKGKSSHGLLVFSIKEKDGNAEITFSDDGAGFNWEKIKAKYLKLKPDAQDLSRKVLLGAVFLPEFSTSDETTTVAGRGVGMSLIKDIVKENNGTINVNSAESGLTLKFTFPL